MSLHMSRRRGRVTMQLPLSMWPQKDQSAWDAAFVPGDCFDENGLGAHLARSTRQVYRESYGRFLGFVTEHHPELLSRSAGERLDPEILAEYVAWRRRSCSDRSVAIDLQHLRGALKLICSESNWSWLLTISKRIAAGAQQAPRRYHLVTSERLYALGVELMDDAVSKTDEAKRLRKADALQYRDGLLIALAALIPLRRRTEAALRMGRQLIKTSGLWALEIPGTDTKNGRPLDYPISAALSSYIDVYLQRFRRAIPGADKHDGLWASNQGRPMCGEAISQAVKRRTKVAFGFAVNFHRFRHAAASLWSIRDTANVRGAKDLLGHASFGMTEAHYIMAQSRLAGRALASVVDAARAGPSGS